MTFFVVWLVVLLKAKGSSIVKPTSNTSFGYLLDYIITSCDRKGLKGLMAIGLLSLVMSTADSYLNTSAVIVADVLPLSHQGDNKRARWINLLLGLVALGFALAPLSFKDLLSYSLFFYIPTLAVPVLATLAGFRTSRRAIVAGMVAAIITAVGCLLYHGS